MFVKLVDYISFTFNLSNSNSDFIVGSGKGKLYLADDSVLVSDGDRWYCLPIDKINDIERFDGENSGIEFKIPGMKVRVNGHNRGPLWALRHFLLPSIR